MGVMRIFATSACTHRGLHNFRFHLLSQGVTFGESGGGSPESRRARNPVREDFDGGSRDDQNHYWSGAAL